MGLAQIVQFPCETMPEHPGRARLLGIYPQRPDGLFFQRVRLPGGQIRVEQWNGLAALVARYSPDYPLHLTTRQDIELHGIHPEDVPAVQGEIARLGMTCAGACGDTVRNVTICPGNGLRRDTWDVSKLATTIQSRFGSIPWITDLPRKFKIGICGCGESCTKPWINDLGLVANQDGTFRAVVAGSLGAKPAAGILLEESLEIRHIVPLVMALLKLFHAEGDRARRHQARLRHVRQRLGNEAFVERIKQLFHQEIQSGASDVPGLWRVVKDKPLQAHIHLPLGDIVPEAAIELGEAAAKAEATLRIGLDHDLLLFGPRPLALSSAIHSMSLPTSVVACPGTTWCTKGIVDSRGAASRIACRLSHMAGMSIAVSGCPNNCPQSAIASIGLVGRVARIDGRPVKGFRLLVGGGQGREPVLARELCPFVTADDVDEVVAWLIEEYRRAADCNGTPDFKTFLSREFQRLAEALGLRYPIRNERIPCP